MCRALKRQTFLSKDSIECWQKPSNSGLRFPGPFNCQRIEIQLLRGKIPLVFGRWDFFWRHRVLWETPLKCCEAWTRIPGSREPAANYLLHRHLSANLSPLSKSNPNSVSICAQRYERQIYREPHFYIHDRGEIIYSFLVLLCNCLTQSSQQQEKDQTAAGLCLMYESLP